MGYRDNFAKIDWDSNKNKIPSISGTLKDSSGDPISHVYVSVGVAIKGDFISRAGCKTQSDGSFKIYDLKPERYVLLVQDPRIDTNRFVEVFKGETLYVDYIIKSRSKRIEDDRLQIIKELKNGTITTVKKAKKKREKYTGEPVYVEEIIDL